MSTSRPSSGAPRGRDPRPRPVLPVRAVVRTAVVALVLTVVAAAVVLPATASLLGGAPDVVAFGVLLVLSSACRLLAGAVGARRAHAITGARHRFEAVPAVAVGAAAAWVVYALALAVVAATGGDVPWLRVALELPRWVAEAALGAVLVTPAAGDRGDPSLRRYVVHPRRDGAR